MSDIVYYNRWFDYYILVVDGSWYSNNSLHSTQFISPKNDYLRHKEEFEQLEGYLLIRYLKKDLCSENI